jgi:phosphoribosylaminoimidazole-succinocarboxamide synthase
MEKLEKLYEGKAKCIWSTEDKDRVIQEFKDDTTAFDGVKHEVLIGKGFLNCCISSAIFERLNQEFEIVTHFIKQLSPTTMLVRKLKMLPIEVVVRNIIAGSLAKRYGLTEGDPLPEPIYEFFLKNDELHDPLVNEIHMRVFNWASKVEIELMRAAALKVNEILVPFFETKGILLVDYKLEFGTDKNNLLYIGDEISADSCRLWDKETGAKMDKDVFRRSLGNVIDAYSSVLDRLKKGEGDI